MTEGRRNSVEIPLSKTLVALKRVRSLRDPDTNSMGKFAMGIDSLNLDANACRGEYLGFTDSDIHQVNKSHNCGSQERLEDVGSNSESDYASSKISSTIKIRPKDLKKSQLVHQQCWHSTKKSLEPSLSLHPINPLDDELNSYSEPRINGTVGNKRSGHRSCGKSLKPVEAAAMSRLASPCMSSGESRTHYSSQGTAGLVIEEADIVDSSYNGCGISYCWSRTPKYREATRSPDVETEEHPLLSAEGGEAARREIVPYPESPRSLSQKFRPRSFNDLVGLRAVAKSLLYAVSKGKIAPVYLFHGPRGTGKTSTARIFAAALNCLSLEGLRPCGFCRECVFLFSGRSRDVKELDAVKINRKDRVKAVMKSASLAPFSSHFKVFIIDECQFLRGEMWAAIFSSIEFLSHHCVFIMITTHPDKLPHSSLSQCQRYHFPKIMDADISCRLQKICIEEGLEFDKDALDFIASKCNGSLRDAETILDQLGLLGKRITLSLAYELIGIVSDDELLDLLDVALSSDTTNTVRRARDLMRSRVDPMQLVSQLANLIMDILSGRSQSDISEVGKIYSGRQALAKVGMHKLRHALKILSETEKQLRTSKNQATWLTVALLQFGSAGDGYLSSNSPRDSLKNAVCYEDHQNKSCPGTYCTGTELETIWRGAIRKCQSSSLKSFLQKECSLSSIHVNEGLAVAEIEFFHPDHVSRAEKSWKLIASSLQHVLLCDVQLRLKLVPTYARKRVKVKKPSFSLLSCSSRKQKMSDSTMTEETESETSYRETFSHKGHQLDSKPMQEVCCLHDKETVVIRKVEDMRSSKTTSDRCARVNIQNDCKLKPDSPNELDKDGQCVDIQDRESQPNCFAKILKLRRRNLRADTAQSICLRIQSQGKRELTISKKVLSETYFNTYDPYDKCSSSNAEVTCNFGENETPIKGSKFSSKLLCWRPPINSPGKRTVFSLLRLTIHLPHEKTQNPKIPAMATSQNPGCDDYPLSIEYTSSFENPLSHVRNACETPTPKAITYSSAAKEKKPSVKRGKGKGKSSLEVVPKIRTKSYIIHYCDFMKVTMPRLPTETIDLLQGTPFRHYLEFTAIAQDRPIIEMLISSYDQKCDKFKIGDEYHTFDVTWVSEHTWLPRTGNRFDGSKKVKTPLWLKYIQKKKKSENPRTFLENEINDLLNYLEEEKDEQLIDDLAKLLIIYQLTMIWMPPAGDSVPLSFFSYVRSYQKINDVNWAGAVHRAIMEGVINRQNTKKCFVSGCQVLLALWYFERSGLRYPQYVDHSKPPMLHWSYKGSMKNTVLKEKLRQAVAGPKVLGVDFIRYEEKQNKGQSRPMQLALRETDDFEVQRKKRKISEVNKRKIEDVKKMKIEEEVKKAGEEQLMIEGSLEPFAIGGEKKKAGEEKRTMDKKKQEPGGKEEIASGREEPIQMEFPNELYQEEVNNAEVRTLPISEQANYYLKKYVMAMATIANLNKEVARLRNLVNTNNAQHSGEEAPSMEGGERENDHVEEEDSREIVHDNANIEHEEEDVFRDDVSILIQDIAMEAMKAALEEKDELEEVKVAEEEKAAVKEEKAAVEGKELEEDKAAVEEKGLEEEKAAIEVEKVSEEEKKDEVDLAAVEEKELEEEKAEVEVEKATEEEKKDEVDLAAVEEKELEEEKAAVEVEKATEEEKKDEAEKAAVEEKAAEEYKKDEVEKAAEEEQGSYEGNKSLLELANAADQVASKSQLQKRVRIPSRVISSPTYLTTLPKSKQKGVEVEAVDSRYFTGFVSKQEMSQRTKAKKPVGKKGKMVPIAVSDSPEKLLQEMKSLAIVSPILHKHTGYFALSAKQAQNCYKALPALIRKDGSGFKPIIPLKGLDTLPEDLREAVEAFIRDRDLNRKAIWAMRSKYSAMTGVELLDLLTGEEMSDIIFEAFIKRCACRIQELAVNAHIVSNFFCSFLIDENKVAGDGTTGRISIESTSYNMFMSEPVTLGKSPIYIPICNAGHWHLLVLDLEDAEFRHYSSIKLAGENNPWVWAASAVMQSIKRFGRKSLERHCPGRVLRYRICECPQQTNGEDCGMYVYLYMLALIEGRDISTAIDGRSPEHWRTYIAGQIIVEGSEVDPYPKSE